MAIKDEQQPLEAVTTPQIGSSDPSDSSTKLVNRVGGSKSPFVSAKARDAVAWQLLDDQAVEAARRSNKLIFLHIGYKACHYCHLMATESFSHPDCASILNESFIPVVVDRDERPDLDMIYMNYVQAVSATGGWPLNMFLTPELEPILGGTYWPGGDSSAGASGGASSSAANTDSVQSPTGGYDDQTDFVTVLKRVRQIWTEQEQRCRAEAKDVVQQLREFAAEGTLGTREISSHHASHAQGDVKSASHAQSDVKSALHHAHSTELDLDQLEEAFTHISGTYDPTYAGFGLAPKFIAPSKLMFLLRLSQLPQAVQDVVGDSDCARAREMALQTLRRVRDGSLRDHIGGSGIARCSVTHDWTVPNFEKIVADNALLLNLYLEAWKLSKVTDEFLDMVVELVDYLTSAPIVLADGTFATSEAADSCYRRGDSAMGEGAYYVWTRREFEAAITSNAGTGTTSALDTARMAAIAAMHWNVLEDGNVNTANDPHDTFVNQNILRIISPVPALAKSFGLTDEQVRDALSQAKQRLRSRRERDRVRPEIDNKVVAGWNGLVVSALAKAGRRLKGVDDARAEKSIDVATRAAASLKEKLWDAKSKTLYRIWKDGRGDVKAFADDYAYLIQGLLDLYDATQDKGLLVWAKDLQDAQIHLFYDPLPHTPHQAHSNREAHHLSGAFYTTTINSSHVILRLKDGIDTSLPSTNAVSAENLFRLSFVWEGDDAGAAAVYAARAKETVAAFEAETVHYPWLFPGLLSGVVWLRLGVEGLKKICTA